MTDTAPIFVLGKKVRLLQPENGFRTSLDSVLLAAACPAKEGARILDMGAGVGGAAFCLLWRVENTHVTGVEIQEDYAEMACENIALNAMQGRAEFITADITSYQSDKPFDHVMCNPPYLEAGKHTPSPYEDKEIAIGHAEKEISVKDWIDAGYRAVKSGGSLTLIHRADMTDKIITGLGKRFGAVEIIPLYPKQGQAARRVIIRAIKDRKSPAKLHAGLILHNEDGQYSQSADAILRDGAAIE